MKKTVAIGIAGATALVVGAWRRVQRDNTLASDFDQAGDSAPEPAGSTSNPSPRASSAPSPAASAQSLFAPSVSEKSTKSDLYEVATELDIQGRSKMSKAELLEAIRATS